MPQYEPSTQIPYPEPSDIPYAPDDFSSMLAVLVTMLNRPYASTAARDAAIPSPAAREIAVTGTGSVMTVWIHDGTTWKPLWQDPGWTAYTPTLSGVTLGTGGTNTAGYQEIAPGLYYAEGLITLGTGGDVTSSLFVGAPFNAQGEGQITAIARDASTTQRWPLVGYRPGVGTFGFNVPNAASAAASVANATSPFDWAVGDTLSWQATFRKA